MDANEQRIDAHLARVDDDAGREPERVTCASCERTVPIEDTTTPYHREYAGLCGPVRRPVYQCHRCTKNERIALKHRRARQYTPPKVWQ